jgi:hypothetical protein
MIFAAIGFAIFAIGYAAGYTDRRTPQCPRCRCTPCSGC